jgi:sulfhydrogenase subunit gamma (sulfur reductase)
MNSQMENIYKPYLLRVVSVKDETPDVRTMRLQFVNEAEGKAFSFKAGQFAEYSVFGEGECTFCIASSPTRMDAIECSYKLVGKVTAALRDREVDEIIGFRGPYGNWFPINMMKGKNLLFVGGGIGLAPLRSLIWNVLDTRADFGDITILYGARTVADLVYKDELADWEQRSGVKTVYTVDPGGETPDWKGKVGFVPTVLEQSAPSKENTIVITCGPPIMIKFAVQSLVKMGFESHNIVTTLENRMKCGLGKCGRCNIGSVYVCKDGPVFTYDQIKNMPDEF